jgi:hypothetical protein
LRAWNRGLRVRWLESQSWFRWLVAQTLQAAVTTASTKPLSLQA